MHETARTTGAKITPVKFDLADDGIPSWPAAWSITPPTKPKDKGVANE